MALNVVVHQSMLEDEEREPSAILGEHDEALRALRRIRGISGYEHTIEFEGFNFDSLSRLCRGHESVVLYGCCRENCLEKAADVLQRSGYSVAYDIDGTTF